jgi:uncharacterized protein (UPF0264 family)
MRLLVSVQDADEAAAALAGDADLIDAKAPGAGALGAVAPGAFRGICRAVGGRRPVTAALGEARAELEIETAAGAFAGMGASLVKVGFAGVTDAERAAALLAAAVRGARAERPESGVVAVAYADSPPADTISAQTVIDVAVRAGAAGVLLDTSNKAGATLSRLLPESALAAWVADARMRGLVAMLAGRLTPADLPLVYEAGADVAGVRGAACDGGRSGRVSAIRVRELAMTCRALRRAGHEGHDVVRQR